MKPLVWISASKPFSREPSTDMAPSRRCVFVLLVATAATLKLTAADVQPSFGGISQQGPCFDAVDPKLWPVKPESLVCATDGLLYPSKSAVECTESLKGFGGPTSNATAVVVQPRDKCGAKAKLYDPCSLAFSTSRQVCGSDNATYNTLFEMACTARTNNVEISVRSEGDCKINCPRSPIYKPVCSSPNDETFPNEEALRCEQILKPYSKMQLKHEGECTYNPCSTHTEFSFVPVCASNGRTYANSRQVRCLKKSNPALAVLHSGECTVQEVEKSVGLDDVCRVAMHTYELNPLCGSDNISYSNAYTFLCASKSSPKDKKLTMAYEGDCFAIEKCPDPVSPKNAIPVCGSDGVNYPNENAFNCAKFNSTTLQKVNPNECFQLASNKEDPCLPRQTHSFGQIAIPVCGSNKVSYVSQNDLMCAAKTKPEISLLHFGECF